MKKQLFVVLITSVIVSSISGCIPVAVVAGAGAVALRTSEVSLHVTEDSSEVINCIKFGHNRKSSLWGGVLFKAAALKKVINELSLWAESVGGDTLLLEETTNAFMGSSAAGTAYKCNS